MQNMYCLVLYMQSGWTLSTAAVPMDDLQLIYEVWARDQDGATHPQKPYCARHITGVE